jgi:hypothetical protein
MRPALALGTTSILALILLAGMGSLAARSQSDSSLVYVANFPDVQQVEGTVRVEGLESFGSLVQIDAIDVTPVPRETTTRLIDAGTVDTDGFSHVVLSVFGEVRGELTRPGRVGAVLVPDSDISEKLLKTKGVFLFPLEVSASLDTQGGSVFMAEQRRFEVGFPSYRLLLYNTSDRTAITSVAVYRTK